MFVLQPLSNLRGSDRSWSNSVLLLFILILALGSGLALAYLAVGGRWPIALALLLALPGFVLLHRYPFAALIIWLLLAPFVIATHSTQIRRIYWLIHRALPVATVGIVVLSAMLRIHRRKLSRLGLPELAMGGYVVASLVSIIYLHNSVEATTYRLYDRVVVPMSLYLLVRLTRPSEKDLRRLLPVLVFIVLTQSTIGLISWFAPQLLPEAWLTRVGTRTTGSLEHYGVFTSTMTFCGLFLLHSTLNARFGKWRRLVSTLVFILAGFMIFLSLSRASWLAGLFVMLGLLWLYPKQLLRLGLVATLFVGVLLASGLLAEQIEYAGERFYSEQSEESALSRLPVYYASLRMFETKPLFGWGYANFDRYDRQFQMRVADLVTPEKDHASHNAYLTLIAEQGLVGTLLFLAPVLWWLALTIMRWPVIPAEGFWGRKLVAALWLVILFQFVVNNFADMRVVFGLGIWWITLGLIGTIIASFPQRVPAQQRVG